MASTNKGQAAKLRSSHAVRDAVQSYKEDCVRDQPACWICGQAIDYDLPYDPTNSGMFQVDHVFPVSKYPELAADKGNMKPSHAGCNRNRGNKGTGSEIGRTSIDWEALGN